MYGRQIEGRKFISREKDFSFLKAFFFFFLPRLGLDLTELSNQVSKQSWIMEKNVEADPENVW